MIEVTVAVRGIEDVVTEATHVVADLLQNLAQGLFILLLFLKSIENYLQSMKTNQVPTC